MRKIILNGIKNYEAKRKSRIRKNGIVHLTAKMSVGSRWRKKLLSKSNWFKRGSKEKEQYDKKGGVEKRNTSEKGELPEIKSVLFCEYTAEGELANKLRELMKRLGGVLGFTIKVVERTGRTLKSHFPLDTMGEGAVCGRDSCTTCTQGAETIPDCKKPSLIYKNVCQRCNPGAGAKGALKEVRKDIPSLYVGESSLTIFERSREHWEDWRRKSGSSHIRKHQEQAHADEEEPPKFIMRVVRFCKTPLSRQIGEAVRIRRRGGEGSILNSKAEYSRCRIPRLVVE